MPGKSEQEREDRGSIHLVVLIHGIRDFGEWEDSVKRVLKGIPGIKVVPLGYEYYDPLRFLVPALFQRGPQRTIAMNIKQEKKKLEKKGYSKVKVSVVAHSFGTHVILGILDDDQNADLDLENLILCGAVLPRLYNFRKIMPMVKNRILNFVGCRDIWPVMAKISTFGYGSAGTFGFQGAGPDNLYFDFGHGGYFSESFIQDQLYKLFGSDDPDYAPDSDFKRRHPTSIRWLGKLFDGAIPIVLLLAIYAFSPALSVTLNEGRNLVSGLIRSERAEAAESGNLVAQFLSGKPAAEIRAEQCLVSETLGQCFRRLTGHSDPIE